MKFQRLEALEKHLDASFPDHLSPIYMMVCPDVEERSYLLSAFIKRFSSLGDLKKALLLEEAFFHLRSQSLLEGRVMAAYEAPFLSKREADQVIHYIAHPNPEGIFLLCIGKASAQVYSQGKKEIVFLDLSFEKPWDRKERLKKWVVGEVMAEKKRITPDAVEALFERLPPQRHLLRQELNKLLCFVGEKEQITRYCVEEIVSDLLEINQFQLAERIVWGELKNIPEQKDLFPLIGCLRNLFERGLKMHALLKKGASLDDVICHFPKVAPRTLEKKLQAIKRKEEAFFLRGLKSLFELELGLKTSLGSPELLFTRFCFRINR